MKRNKLIIPIILGSILGLIELFHWNSKVDYAELVTCTCLRKYETVSDGGTKYFYMVLKTHKDNITFDLDVTPGTYYSNNTGDNVTFKLNQTQFRPNTEWIGNVTVLGTFGIIILAVFMICWIVDYDDSY